MRRGAPAARGSALAEQFGDEPQCQLSIMYTQQSGAIDSHCVARPPAAEAARLDPVWTVSAARDSIHPLQCLPGDACPALLCPALRAGTRSLFLPK